MKVWYSQTLEPENAKPSVMPFVRLGASVEAHAKLGFRNCEVHAEAV